MLSHPATNRMHPCYNRLSARPSPFPPYHTILHRRFSSMLFSLGIMPLVCVVAYLSRKFTIISIKKAPLFLLVFSAFLLSSCGSNPGVVQLSPDTYFISRTDKAGLFGNASKMKTEVIQEANEFAVVGVTKTEPLRELVWEPRKDPDYERKEIHHRAEDPHIA